MARYTRAPAARTAETETRGLRCAIWDELPTFTTEHMHMHSIAKGGSRSIENLTCTVVWNGLPMWYEDNVDGCCMGYLIISLRSTP